MSFSNDQMDICHDHNIGFINEIKLHSGCFICITVAKNQMTKLEMNFEKFRIQSFKHWPKPYIDVKSLAMDGLYHTGYGDRVVCNFCNLGIYEWECDDDPLSLHRKWSPWCKRQKSENNISLKILTEEPAIK